MIRKNKLLTTLLILAIAIRIFALFPSAVERYYTNGIYPVIALALRFLFGWIPFSIGDLVYAAAAIYLSIQIIRLAWRVSKRKTGRKYWISAFRRIITVALVVYVWFNISWGLNYNRPDIAASLQLDPGKYDKEDLVKVMRQLVIKLNELEPDAKKERPMLATNSFLFDRTIDAYRQLAKNAPEFKYSIPSIKPSLYSYLGNYLGFTGYYNPFTGEAQVNTTVPVFIRPFTSCHEVGHQLGFARENEANFVGFLSARSSSDAAFRYSVYFDMYGYARRYLYEEDSLLLKQTDSTLNEGVRQDFRELREFILRHENPFEVIIDRLYSQYLRANQQPAGRVTYNQVIIYLIAYYRKYHQV
jgi:hypothetical protein